MGSGEKVNLSFTHATSTHTHTHKIINSPSLQRTQNVREKIFFYIAIAHMLLTAFSIRLI